MERILDVGCGTCKHVEPGAITIGIDIAPLPGVDVLCNIEYPLPFKDDSFDKAHANGVMEHTHNFLPLMEELHRIVKGSINIMVPYFASKDAFRDPTHCRFFTYETFDIFEPETKLNHFYSCARFKILKKYLNFRGGQGRLTLLNKIINPFVNVIPRFYEAFLCGIIRCDELYVSLTRLPRGPEKYKARRITNIL